MKTQRQRPLVPEDLRPVSLSVQIAALRRRLLRLGKEKRRAALVELMEGLRFHPLSYGPLRNKRPSVAKRVKQAEEAVP